MWERRSFNMGNAERQKELIAWWYQACRVGDYESADELWEMFIKELEQ